MNLCEMDDLYTNEKWNFYTEQGWNDDLNLRFDLRTRTQSRFS